MYILRSQRTMVLKRLFAIKKGWLNAVTGELRAPGSGDDATRMQCLTSSSNGVAANWQLQCSGIICRPVGATA